jgi:putative transposase
MARPLRPSAAGDTMHLWIRGNNRQPCFLADKDRHVYLKCLVEEARSRECDVHNFVLMSNHVHLLATARRAGSISRFMQTLNRRYCRYVNEEHHRTGTLWEGRFNSSLVVTEHYFFTLMRYIELNPVRAGMVVRPGDYRWSSHRENASGAPSQFVTPHRLYLELGRCEASRREAYFRLFDAPLDDDTLETIRKCINRGGPLQPDGSGV